MFKIPDKIYIQTGGGLGDIVRCYLKDEPYWGILKSIKQQNKDTDILVVSSSHNPEVESFFKYNPYINKVKELGWMVDGRELAKNTARGYALIDTIYSKISARYERPEIFLGPEDMDVYKKVKEAGEYIFVHPFAMRAAMPLEDFVYMIDEIIDNSKYNIVVVGATHERTARKGATGPNDPGGKLLIKEELEYERPGLFNLTNKANVRIAMRLCQEANGFLGHCSCYNIVAWIHGIKSFVFSPPTERQLLSSLRSHAWPLMDNLPWCKNLYSDEWGSSREAAKQAVEFLIK